MNFTTKLEAIEKLRETRERSAFGELESSNRAHDLAEATAAGFEKHLQIQTETVRAQQTQLYEEIIGKNLSSEDFDEMRSRVDSKNAKLDLLAEQCGKAKDAATSAGEIANNAKAKHVQVFRAKQKWAAVMKRDAERLQRSENHRDELAIEDSFGHLRTSW
jgi:hypothetical protein